MAPWLINGAVTVLLAAVLDIVKLLWGLLSQTAFSTPDVTTLPQVATISSTSLLIVNVSFILAIITAGIVVMARETVQTRYGIAELVPRLVIGWLAANFAVPICGWLIHLANAITVALTGDGVTAQRSLEQLYKVMFDALNNPPSAFLALLIGLVVAVLTALLILTWLARLGVLLILAGVAPVALACHATPYTEAAARLWWRTMTGTLGTVVLQAVALHTALSIFLDPDANVAQLGLPHDPTGTFNLFLVLCLLWMVVKIPGLMRRFVTAGGGANMAGAFVRMVLVQQLTRALRLPGRGSGGGRAGRAARGGGPRGGGPGGGTFGAGTRMPSPIGSSGGGSSRSASPSRLPAPRGARPGRVGVAWPTGRAVQPYTAAELAAGVDPYTRTVRTAPSRSAATPSRSSPPPVSTAGGQSAPLRARPRPAVPPGMTPAAVRRARPPQPPSGP